jgi:DNA modification methylase
VIERSIQIWSQPGEVVLDPFAGIGSTGVGAIRQARQFVGVELKPEYCDVAAGNLRVAEEANRNKLLFD